MDPLRALQLLTDLAYLLLGIAALRAALRHRGERARWDVAAVFGTLAVVVVLQEIPRLSCGLPSGCLAHPSMTVVAVVLVLLLPYTLLRLVEDIADIPRWSTWLVLVVLVTLSTAFVLAAPTPPGWLILVLTVYLVLGTGSGAVAFVRRAGSATGITRRRMAAVSWGFGLLAATLMLGLIGQALPALQAVLTLLSRLATLASGLCFWAGFFPPSWLSQMWRVPELLEYLRPGRLMGGASPSGLAAEAMALDRLTAAAASTTGARRALLLLDDVDRQDLYLWGAPSARVAADAPLIASVTPTSRPQVVPLTASSNLPPAILSVFASETLPRTVMLVPVNADGRRVGVLAAFADKGPMFVDEDLEIVRFFAGEAAAILELRVLREATNELEALRQADRLKDEFMAVVSHELRTPLTAITGYSDILLRKLSGELNERQERHVLGIRDASRRLLALINDLLDVSKLESGTLDLHLEAMDPHAAVVRAVTSTRVIATTKGVHLHVSEPSSDVPLVLADEGRLQQILTNLLVNAIKFTPASGSVWISVRSEPAESGGARMVVFQVEDTGLGLSPSQAERIWDRFYQAESTSARRFGGAGLGLSIVRRLTELHGGTVDATSPGFDRGSTFRVHLPAARPVQHEEPVLSLPARLLELSGEQTLEENGRAARALVLVVEDDPHISGVLRTYLESDGFQVAIVADGQQALQAARALEPFAITLDISLPKVDGWSVLNALKRDRATADIPVVIISIVDNRDFGMLLGATEYLVKPIDHERLQTVLRQVRKDRADDEPGLILVVDDEPALREALSSALSEDGWRTATAADGDAALELLEHERPAAVVLDLMMPRVDGFEVLQRIRAQPALHDLSAIVITARELTDSDRQRLAGLAQSVILKHARSMDQLLEDLRGALRRHRARSSAEART